MRIDVTIVDTVPRGIDTRPTSKPARSMLKPRSEMNEALALWFGRVFLPEPVPTSLENAISKS